MHGGHHEQALAGPDRPQGTLGCTVLQGSAIARSIPQGKQAQIRGLFERRGHQLGPLGKQPVPGIVIPVQLPQVGMPGIGLH